MDAGDGADRLLRAAPRTHTLELGLKVAAFTSRSRPGALDEGGLQPGGALAHAVDRRLPALSSFLGHSPAQEIRWPSVGKRLMSVPISAIPSLRPLRSLIAGDGGQHFRSARERVRRWALTS